MIDIATDMTIARVEEMICLAGTDVATEKHSTSTTDNIDMASFLIMEISDVDSDKLDKMLNENCMERLRHILSWVQHV